jgi:hypothetical protein
MASSPVRREGVTGSFTIRQSTSGPCLAVRHFPYGPSDLRSRAIEHSESSEFSLIEFLDSNGPAEEGGGGPAGVARKGRSQEETSFPSNDTLK